MGATTFGPVLGPILSGYISPHAGWRWTFWAALILIGVSWIPLTIAPESYGPIILKKRAQRLRKETGNENIKAPIELEIKDIRHTITVVLTRPIRMICTEGKLRCQPLTSECCKQGSGLKQARQQLSFSPAYFCPWSIPYSSCSCRLSLSFSKVRAHCPGAKGARPVRH